MNKLNEHIESGYFVKVMDTGKVEGIHIKFPSNLFLDLSEDDFIFYYDSGQVKVFLNGKKIDEYKCPVYAAKPSIHADITRISTYRQINGELFVSYSKDGERTFSKQRLIELIQINERQIDLTKRKKLVKFISESSSLVDIPEDIIDGYDLVISRFF